MRKKAVVINGKGDKLIDGAVLTNDLNGRRTLNLLAEGVEADVVDFGLGNARRIYRQPGTIGKAIRASEHIAKILDVDTIANR